jgi:hypothetical protein
MLVGLVERDRSNWDGGIRRGIELAGLHSFDNMNKSQENRQLAYLMRIGDRTDSDRKVFQLTHALDSSRSNKRSFTITTLAIEHLKRRIKGGGLV